MKKVFYVALFTLLGIITSFLIHALIEIPIIWLLLSDFERWGLGLSWDTWETVHSISSITLFIIGVVVGLKFGKHFWRVIYVDKTLTIGKWKASEKIK